MLKYFLDTLRTSYLDNQNKQINQIPNKKNVKWSNKKMSNKKAWIFFNRANQSLMLVKKGIELLVYALNLILKSLILIIQWN